MLRNDSEYDAQGLVFHGSIPHVMGTRMELVAVGSDKETMDALWSWSCVEAETLDTVLNRFDPESEVSRLNLSASGPAHRAGALLSRMVSMALSYHDRTFGLFDIAKGGLDEVEIDADGFLHLHGHQLDFGGFAKGCLLRDLRERLVLAGVRSAFLDFGGSSIATIGSHPFGDCWRVGVRDPFTGAVVTEVELVGRSMSTSGNSPGHSSHIVNPFTGESVGGRRMVTVLSDDPLDAEVLSTALMVAGPEETELLRGNFPQCEPLFFDRG